MLEQPRNHTAAVICTPARPCAGRANPQHRLNAGLGIDENAAVAKRSRWEDWDGDKWPRPCDAAVKKAPIDNSDTSNSSYFIMRQKISSTDMTR